MLSVDQARAKAEALVEQAQRRRGRCRRRDLCRRAVERRAGAQGRARGCPSLRRRGDRPARVPRHRNRPASSSSDLSAEALSALVARALAMAAEAPEDPYAGLAPRRAAGQAAIRRSRWLGRCRARSGRRSKARALEAESGGAGGRRASPTATAPAPTPRRSTVALAISSGFCRRLSRDRPQLLGQRRRRRRLGDAARLCLAQRAPRRGSRRPRRDRPPRRRAGGGAAEPGQARRRADAGPVRAARRDHPARPFRRARSPARRSRASRASCRTGSASRSSRRASRSTTIRCASAASAAGAFDGEGLPVRPLALVDDGVLKTWLAESASARQLGIAPTGHAIRGVGGAPGAGPSNLYLAAGTAQPRGAARRVSRG